MRVKCLCKKKTQVKNLSSVSQTLHWCDADVLSLFSECINDLYAVCLLNIYFHWLVSDLFWFLELILIHWTHSDSLNLVWFIELLFSHSDTQDCCSLRYFSEWFSLQDWTVLRVHWWWVIRSLNECWLSWIEHCENLWAQLFKSKECVNLCELNRKEECDAQFALISHKNNVCLHLKLSLRSVRH